MEMRFYSPWLKKDLCHLCKSLGIPVQKNQQVFIQTLRFWKCLQIHCFGCFFLVPNLSSVTDHLLMVPMPILVGDIPVQLYETVTRIDPIYSMYPNDVQKPPSSPLSSLRSRNVKIGKQWWIGDRVVERRGAEFWGWVTLSGWSLFGVQAFLV